jgi:alkanesulfonate monooxygenase SsuD/methylene tetrahydromethanopterin reductase-like flavin-dependent oxidoreductase (luciferase family)
VDTARLYSVPDQPPPIYISGFGEHSARLASKIAAGYIRMGPQADLIKPYREEGGGERTVQGGIKGCWAPDEDTTRATHAPAVAERHRPRARPRSCCCCRATSSRSPGSWIRGTEYRWWSRSAGPS